MALALAGLRSLRATAREPKVCEIGKKLGAGCGLEEKGVWGPGGREPTQAAGWKEGAGREAPRRAQPHPRNEERTQGRLPAIFLKYCWTSIPKCLKIFLNYKIRTCNNQSQP